MATSSVSQYADTLDTIFIGLKSPETRLQYALELRRYVVTKVVEMPSDTATKPWEDSINQRLFEPVWSPHSHDNLGGIVAIDHLHDVDDKYNHNIFRYFNHVRFLLPNGDFNDTLAASKTLGKIVGIGGATFGETFNSMGYQVPAAINLLQVYNQESARYAGVLILKELARNGPVYFHPQIDLVVDNVLIPLRDPSAIVREGAAELLTACLEIIAQWEKQGGISRLSKVLADARAGLKMSQPEIIHGSLLTYQELLLHGGMFMHASFMDTAESILRFGTSRDPFVRKTVVTLIPTLVMYGPQTFGEHFLHEAMGYLLTLLGESNDREFAFVAIRHMAEAVGSDIMKPFLECISKRVGEDEAQVVRMGR